MEVWNIPYSRYCFHDRGWKYRRHKAHGNTDEDGSRSAVNRCENEGENPKLGLRRRGSPSFAEEEVHQADLPDGGQARGDEINTDKQDKADGDDAEEQEDQVHRLFQGIMGAAVFHIASRPFPKFLSVIYKLYIVP